MMMMMMMMMHPHGYFRHIILVLGNQDNAVGIATGCGLDDTGVGV
jgi:hypothetical protein